MKISEKCLVEIYSIDSEKFSVGEIVYQNNDIALFRLVNTQGQWDGFSIYKKECISNIVYDTDYLKKINMYIQYWNKPKTINELEIFESEHSFLNFLQKLFKKQKLITVITKDKSIFLGYINSINDSSIFLDCIDDISATFDNQTEILLKDIIIANYDDIDNTLLNFVLNRY